MIGSCRSARPSCCRLRPRRRRLLLRLSKSMDEPSNRRWFLRKHEDGSIFGPLPFAQLARWASTAQIAPHDAVSTDQLTWMKAPMLPQVGRDWLVEVTSERSYGPTTLGAIQEFIRLGEIDADTFVINACDG